MGHHNLLCVASDYHSPTTLGSWALRPKLSLGLPFSLLCYAYTLKDLFSHLYKYTLYKHVCKVLVKFSIVNTSWFIITYVNMLFFFPEPIVKVQNSDTCAVSFTFFLRLLCLYLNPLPLLYGNSALFSAHRSEHFPIRP